jgi:hypothetical protein
MPLWGANTGDESKPKNLTAEEKSRTFATTRGWEIRRPDGLDEVLVAIRNLSGGVVAATDVKLEAANITQVYFTDATVDADTLSTVRVVWNERITPTTTGTLVVRDLTNSADITATRYGTPGPNYLDFQFRAPVAAAALAVQAQTITLGINDFGSTDITSDLTIASGDVDSVALVVAGTSTLVTATPTPAAITSVYFGANSYSTGATGIVTVNWNGAVTATTTGTLVVNAFNVSSYTITATQVGPISNATSANFAFTVPNTTGQTLSITSQTITLGLVNAGTTATTADLTIALADVLGAANDGGSTSIVTTV